MENILKELDDAIYLAEKIHEDVILTSKLKAIKSEVLILIKK